MLMPFIAAVLPAVLIVAFVLYMDRNMPEPIDMILKAVGLGVLSVVVTLFITTGMSDLGLGEELFENELLSAIWRAFGRAAIPEEAAKLLVLAIFLRGNEDFDEKFDGIVYSVCIGMGFAGLENVFYIFTEDDWVSLSIMRGLLSVPGHYMFAVLMGYFYSMAHFAPSRHGGKMILAYVAPVLAHGIYDTFCFVAEGSELYGGMLMLVQIYLCYRLHKYCFGLMKEHLESDGVE